MGVSPLYRKLKEYVESLVRNQIKNGHFTGEVWTASFTLHSQVRMFCVTQSSWKGLLAVKNIFQTWNSFDWIKMSVVYVNSTQTLLGQ